MFPARFTLFQLAVLTLLTCCGADPRGQERGSDVDAVSSGGQSDGSETGPSTDGLVPSQDERDADNWQADVDGGTTQADYGVHRDIPESNTDTSHSARPTGAETEPNDNRAEATEITLEVGASLTIDGRLTPGDADYYRLEIDNHVQLNAYVSSDNNCSVDTIASVMDAAGDWIASNDDDADSRCSFLQRVELVRPGFYYLVVRGYQDEQDGHYTLRITLGDARCGDGWVNLSEECDDGNHQEGDGCDECILEAIEEMEPNDLPEEATPIDRLESSLPPQIRGDIGADADYFAIEMRRFDRFERFEMYPVGDVCEPAVLDVLDTDGQTYLLSLTFSVSSESPCQRWSHQTPITIPADGTYFLRATGFTPTGYVLKAEIHYVVCGDGIQEGAEECDDGNEESGDSCSATCQLEG